MSVLFEKDEILTILKIGNAYPNCIEEHMDVIKNHKKCWMARLGNNVSSQPMLNSRGYFIIYDRGRVYLSHYSEIIHTKPIHDYPNNYEKLVFCQNPYEYLLLDCLVEIDKCILDKLKYLGNMRIVSETIKVSPKAYMKVLFWEQFFLDFSQYV